MSTQNIRNMIAQIICELDAMDACTPTPAPVTWQDNLAGTPYTNVSMFTDELNETDWLNKRAAYRTTMKNAASGSIQFIGDSMVERNNLAAISAKAVNQGISGESIRQLAYRINETDSNNAPNLIHRAAAAVTMTGVNDLSDTRNGAPINRAQTVEIVYNNLKNWLTGKVVICKLIPVDASVFSNPTNESIKHVNDWIEANFGNKPGVKIVDVNATLAPVTAQYPYGSLLPQYHVDGQHLSAAGYEVLNAAIRARLQELGVL